MAPGTDRSPTSVIRLLRRRLAGAERDLELARAIVDHAADGILAVDPDGIIESANPAAERMFGRGAGRLDGIPLRSILAGDDDVIDLRDRGHPEGEAIGLRPDGTTFPVELTVSHLDLGDRALSTVVARDITERKAFERRLTHQGTHDPLTGLPNRTLFLDRLGHAIDTASRTRRPLAVLFCDLDRFKVVNDSLGHTAGDTLLFSVAARFRNALRTMDTVARFGGDEFVILAEDLASEDHAVVVARKLAESLAEPIRVGTEEIHVTASIGIALARVATTAEELIRDADVAMYRAKSTGRARHEVFDAKLRTQAMQRLDIESALRRGVGLREFVVHFQPELSLATGRIVGAEALVRWEHPDRGLIGPADFLAVAEETGLIVPMGEDIFTQACAEASRWHEALGPEAPVVWINVSARQLDSPGIVDLVRRSVANWLPRADALGLEITETDAVPDDERGRRTVQELTETGVRLAIDDFGTGFASLAYLWRFPADVIKIDQSFVSRLDEERDATVLVKAMIEMAHSLGKTTVAEGVETEEQLLRLRRLGCDTVQGYLLHRPLTAPTIEALLHHAA
jgi:diguanylate cyclase (GGDEF)-like protein/PAS domain S-box-containing protein